jgi:DNA replication protein DnaC
MSESELLTAVANELLTAVRNKSEPADKKTYDVRWVNCPAHNEPYLQLWIPSLEVWATSAPCPACKREEETGEPQPRRGQSVEELRMQLSGIPERFRGKTLKDFTGKAFRQAVEIARSFAPAKGDNLLIVGAIGTGKTSFGSALLADQLASPEWVQGSGRYLPMRDMMETLWADSQPKSWADGGYGQSLVEELKRLKDYRLLILDDVQEIHAPEELSWLERIVAGRSMAKRATILIGGPDLETLATALGTRNLEQVRGWKQIRFADPS